MRRSPLWILIAAGVLLGAPAAVSGSESPIKVERVAPPKKELATVRFLQENRDFLRRRVDALRMIPADGAGTAAALDPRTLAHGEELGRALAGLDTLTRAEEDRFILTGIDMVGRLEAELDSLEQLIADQNSRLTRLEEDFLKEPGTAMVVVLRGANGGELPDSIRVVDGFGDGHRLVLTATEKDALRAGGIVEVACALVEPRDQTWALTLGGGPWSPVPAYLSFEPDRGHLTFLELDLSAARPEDGAAGLRATAWVDAETLPADGDAGVR